MNGMPFATETISLVRITHIVVSEESLTVDLEDGRTISVPIGWYPRLSYATVDERDHFEIAGGGFGIHWPDLDEDIGVDGLILGKRSMESAASFKRWLEQRSDQAQTNSA